MIDREQLFFSLFSPILVPRALRFLVTWFGNEGMWKQPLPDVRKFLTSVQIKPSGSGNENVSALFQSLLKIGRKAN